MIISAYSIYDIKALTYSNPFFAPNHGAAMRIVQDAANDMNTSLARHPNDYIVYHIGHYDTDIGQMTPLDARQHVCDVITLVAPQQPIFNYEGKN